MNVMTILLKCLEEKVGFVKCVTISTTKVSIYLISYFLARVKCNRCGINKSPKRNIKNKMQKQEEIKQPIMQNSVINNMSMNMGSSIQEQDPNDTSLEEDGKKKKPFVERVGDWVCIKCKNLNFSFRIVCNRCQLPKNESDKMFQQYMDNLMNYVKINEMMQAQININQSPYPLELPLKTNANTNSHHQAQQRSFINNNSININNNFYGNYPNNQQNRSNHGKEMLLNSPQMYGNSNSQMNNPMNNQMNNLTPIHLNKEYNSDCFEEEQIFNQ